MCSGSPKLDLPVIDLSLLPSYLKGESQEPKTPSELQKLGEACENLGFFRVINHGIDPTLIKTMDSVARDMFTLPTEVKERAISPIFNSGYTPPDLNPVGKDSMPESMVLTGVMGSSSFEDISHKLWPQGNHLFCETVPAYNSKMTELAHRLTKLIIQSLGLNVSECYTSASFDKCKGWLRLNCYHTDDALSDEPITCKAHTDVGFLTVLYEDEVGGLQIRTKEGKWIDAKPLPGSFIVNISDCLKMWTNAKYRSAEHRVMYGGKKNRRLSVAFFFDVEDHIQIRSPPQLIDEQHPRLYKPVTFGDIKSYYHRNGPTMEGAPTYYMN